MKNSLDPVTIVVVIVGLVLLLAVGGIIALAITSPGQSIPDVLQNVAVGALALLGGLLVPARSSRPRP